MTTHTYSIHPAVRQGYFVEVGGVEIAAVFPPREDGEGWRAVTVDQPGGDRAKEDTTYEAGSWMRGFTDGRELVWGDDPGDAGDASYLAGYREALRQAAVTEAINAENIPPAVRGEAVITPEPSDTPPLVDVDYEGNPLTPAMIRKTGDQVGPYDLLADGDGFLLWDREAHDFPEGRWQTAEGALAAAEALEFRAGWEAAGRFYAERDEAKADAGLRKFVVRDQGGDTFSVEARESWQAFEKVFGVEPWGDTHIGDGWVEYVVPQRDGFGGKFLVWEVDADGQPVAAEEHGLPIALMGLSEKLGNAPVVEPDRSMHVSPLGPNLTPAQFAARDQARREAADAARQVLVRSENIIEVPDPDYELEYEALGQFIPAGLSAGVRDAVLAYQHASNIYESAAHIKSAVETLLQNPASAGVSDPDRVGLAAWRQSLVDYLATPSPEENYQDGWDDAAEGSVDDARMLNEDYLAGRNGWLNDQTEAAYRGPRPGEPVIRVTR